MQQLKKFIPSAVKRRIKTIFNYPSKFIFWLGYNSIYKSKNYKKIKSLKECHKGERCFIIGSGPSISKMDLTLLKNEITFAHNAFYLIAEKVGFLPTYYVVEDQFPAEDNAKEINALHYTQKIVAHDLDYCLNSDNTIYTFLDRNYYDSKLKNSRFSFDCDKGSFWGGTVTYLSIQLAAYMGCKEIYLIGIDLSYKLPNNIKNNIIISETSDPNHFHPEYFGKGKRWHDPKVDRMQSFFEYADSILEQNGFKLFNATLNGNLKKVRRKKYSELFIL